MRAPVLVLSLLLVSNPASAESAAQMASLCRPILTAQMSAEGGILMGQTFEIGMCWGAFATIQEAFAWASSDLEKRFFGVCFPEKNTRSQLVRIFVRYVDEHPELGHEEFFSVAFTALREVFPCQ